MKKDIKIHFGSDNQPVKEGFVNITRDEVFKALEGKNQMWKKWKPDSVSEVHVTNILQYVDGRSRIEFMNRMHKLLAAGAQATITTPHSQTTAAVMDPLLVWPPINEGSFMYFNKQWREVNKIPDYGILADFDFGYGYAFQNGWHQKSEEARQHALVHYNNVVAFVQLTLTKR